ncbi:conserved hypothetical protein [Beggiatoa sp. PS]|nr:conserved hypothetical protein [Beggiatoa sp. PS]
MTNASHSLTTYQTPHRPLKFRLLNWAGTQLKLNHLSPFKLTEESLLKEAEKITGLSDWGNDNFRQPLQIFLESLNKEANLNFVGQSFLKQDCLRLLANRLRLENDFKRYPDILEVPIQKPLFVVGLFRSGTTFIHNLLSQDPVSRWLHVAEGVIPSPPPNKKTWEVDSRFKLAEKSIQFQNSLAPNFSTAHHIDVNKPAECSRLFEFDFIGHLFDFRANVKTYSAWLQEQNLLEAYQYYKQRLQYLAWHWSNEHWVLKAPAHLLTLDALLATFPDACIVHIHRDPQKVLPSVCSLSTMGRSRFSDHIDMTMIGEHWLNYLVKYVERAMTVRENADASRFYDVKYVDFIKDPMKTIRQIYDYFGYQFSEQMENNINQWIEENPQHKRGTHRYTLEQFGLNSKEIDRRFANYYQRFDLAHE